MLRDSLVYLGSELMRQPLSTVIFLASSCSKRSSSASSSLQGLPLLPLLPLWCTLEDESTWVLYSVCSGRSCNSELLSLPCSLLKRDEIVWIECMCMMGAAFLRTVPVFEYVLDPNRGCSMGMHARITATLGSSPLHMLELGRVYVKSEKSRDESSTRRIMLMMQVLCRFDWLC